jgi:hypothetical protein
MKIKKLKEYNKKKILVVLGSARSKDNCPGQDSKTSKIVTQALKDLPDDIEIDLLDLAIEPDKPIIQPCKGCISTAGGAHCNYPCNCYFKKDKVHPDFMSDFDVYKRFMKADAFIVFTPINWWSVSSQVKTMFDRLVCVREYLCIFSVFLVLSQHFIRLFNHTDSAPNQITPIISHNLATNSPAHVIVHSSSGLAQSEI